MKSIAGTEKNIPGSPIEPDAVQSTGCSPDHRLMASEGVRQIDRCNFFIGAEPRVTMKSIKGTDRPSDVVQSIGWSTIDRMASGRCPENRSVQFFHRGRTSSRTMKSICRNREKTQNIPGSPERTRMQSNRPDAVRPSTGWRPEGVRKSIGAIFFIGAEPRVVNHEIDQAETEKKPKTFLVHRSNPDAVQSDRDAVRTIDRMASGRCPENRSVQFFFIGAEPRVEP